MMEYVVFEELMNNDSMKVFRRLHDGNIQFEYYVTYSNLVYDVYNRRLGIYTSYLNPSSNTLEQLYEQVCNNSTFIYELVMYNIHKSKRCI